MPTTADLDLRQVDLDDPDVFAEGPPRAIFAAMREHAPVHENNSRNGPPFWSITRYAMMPELFRDSDTWSNALDGIEIRRGRLVPAEFEDQLFLFMDPPGHRRHRGIVQSVFSPGAIAAREGEIRGHMRQLLDRVAERGECDLVGDLAVKLPLIVMADMFAVPEEDREELFAWSNAMVAPDDPGLRPADVDSAQIIGKFAMYLVGLVQARRQNLGDDILSRLIQAEVDGEQLDDMEITAVFALLFGAGNDTTRNTCAGGAKLLMEQPDVRRGLIDDPSRMPAVVEEIIRHQSPFHYMARTATRDTEIDEVPIPEGGKIALWIASANHDETVFPNPEKLDLARDGLDHIAFGGGGRHHCLGNRLARLEARIFFEELLARFPDMEPAGPPRWMRSNFIHGFTRMPVRFTRT